MKLWKISIILIAVIGIFAGIYIGISKSIDKKEIEQTENSGIGTFLEFDSKDIKSVTFTYDDTSLDFSTEDGSTWTCTNKNMRTNNNNISYAISTMSTLNTTKFIEENSSNLGVYGLDNPITISCTDGTNTYQVQIGNTSPTGESYYIKSPENNDVYTIDYSNGVLMHLTKNDLKNKYILDTYVSAVNKIIYKQNDTIIFNCQKDDNNTWQLLEPTISNINIQLSKISSITDLLIRADVVEFISENPSDSELAEYGLDNPKYTIQIADNNDDRTVYFGNSPEDNVIYAQFEDTKEVVTFYMGELGILDSGTEIILNDIIYEDKQNNLTNLKINYNNETYDFKIDYDDDNNTYSYSQDGTIVTDEEKSNLISILVASSLNIPLYKMQLDDNPTGEPTITITYTRNYEPNEYTLEFIPTDDESKYYYVLMNGDYFGCVVRDRTINSENHILNNLKKILEYQK